MLTPIDSTHLCQLTATQIQEILVLNGVLIEQYQPQLHRWLTIAQLPDLGQLTLSLEPDKVAEIDRRLHQREIVEFTAMTTVMNINICDRYVFVPLLKQPGFYESNETELWGRICLLGNLNSVWTPQDLSWVQALGQQLLTAMNLVGELSTTTESKNAIGSPLSDLAELIERLGKLESICQHKDDYINSIAHDLRAPLMNIKMAMKMLRTSLETDPEISHLLLGHRSEKYLDILEQECDREVESIDRILDLQRLEFVSGERDRVMSPARLPIASIPPLPEQQLNLESLEIATWLPPTIEPFRHRASIDRQKLITSVSQRLPTIRIDRLYLNKIFIELLNNACKYTPVDGEISVEIAAQPNSEWLTIVVKNQAEISRQHLPHIFEQFYRVPDFDRSSTGVVPARQSGSGLGLSLVQKLVDRLNGQIHATSDAGWTEFVVKLPVAAKTL
ncbi:HAMP domain-containing sensor histidine kinase [Chamaesiphon sp. GL140_3_metabinner_50]|uniref:sensor histidine kinase n=1 Tax=Chamaesiphon sp. GL140_3_metabinner_50 TaxID=2970812 RepID=UPI0025D3D36D|nr:HAMP domain-containing sensor histidine kinase [Chamaesiphon sp. GL140_3_metabinner_50]